MAQTESSDIFDRALELEPAKRLALAAKLLDSIEEPEDAEWMSAWAKELDERLKLVESGEDPGQPWEAVKARAIAGLGRR